MVEGIPQSEWREIFHNTGYTLRGLVGLSGICETSIRGYLFEDVVPRKKNKAMMEGAMFTAAQKPKLKLHPSYGYATEQQIKRLSEIGIGPEHEQILKAIEQQTKNRGKYI